MNFRTLKGQLAALSAQEDGKSQLKKGSARGQMNTRDRRLVGEGECREGRSAGPPHGVGALCVRVSSHLGCSTRGDRKGPLASKAKLAMVFLLPGFPNCQRGAEPAQLREQE